jgi:hypothetical protein
MPDSGPTQQLFDVWRKQFEEGTQAWARLASQTAPPPADPFAFWRPILDQGLQNWARLFAQTPATPDLLAQWKQFLDQWIEAWSRVLGQAMNTEAFAQLMGRSLDQWLGGYAPVKKAAEQQVDQALQALNMASRSQLTGVAKQIVEMDERIERMEDGISAVLRKLDEVSRAVAGERSTAEPR